MMGIPLVGREVGPLAVACLANYSHLVVYLTVHDAERHS